MFKHVFHFFLSLQYTYACWAPRMPLYHYLMQRRIRGCAQCFCAVAKFATILVLLWMKFSTRSSHPSSNRIFPSLSFAEGCSKWQGF